jgi:fumarate hydratase class II
MKPTKHHRASSQDTVNRDQAFSSNARTERDYLGEVLVPKSAYWGAQTQRSLKFFALGEEKFPEVFIKVFLLQKWAAAKANYSLGVLGKEVWEAIEKAIKILSVGSEKNDELWANPLEKTSFPKSLDPMLNKTSVDKTPVQEESVTVQNITAHFPLSIWQTGSGTQTHMNVNEVIAHLGNKILEKAHGEQKISKESQCHLEKIHPNDHVNCSQSSNDTVPTVIHGALAWITHQELLPTLELLLNTLKDHKEKFSSVKKVGRTHFQDGVFMTLGQEFSAFYQQIKDALTDIQQKLPSLYCLAQGATAVGTGINASKEFSSLFLKYFQEKVPLPFKGASNLFSALGSHEGLVGFSGALNTLATALFKISQDIRLLSSGPWCGFGELILPENEPGSSIMPGKINPTQAEALSMIALQVMGNHFTR